MQSFNYMDAILSAGYQFRCGSIEKDHGFKGSLPYYYVQIARNHRVFEAMDNSVYGQDYINAQAHTLVEAFQICIAKWNDTATGNAKRIDLKTVYPDMETMIRALKDAGVFYHVFDTARTEHSPHFEMCASIGKSFDAAHHQKGVYGRDYFLAINPDAGEALYCAIRAWNDLKANADQRINI